MKNITRVLRLVLQGGLAINLHWFFFWRPGRLSTFRFLKMPGTLPLPGTLPPPKRRGKCIYTCMFPSIPVSKIPLAPGIEDSPGSQRNRRSPWLPGSAAGPRHPSSPGHARAAGHGGPRSQRRRPRRAADRRSSHGAAGGVGAHKTNPFFFLPVVNNYRF